MNQENFNQTTLITGASSGIGKTFAYQLAKEKHNLIIVARREYLLKKISKEIQNKYKVKIQIIPADLTSEKGIMAIKNFIQDQKIEISMLINNAGFGTHLEFAKSNLEKELAMIDLHCKASLKLIYLFLPQMIKRKKGTIINVASAAAFLPTPYMATYAATKAFMLHFSEALAQEVKSYKIKVLTLCPGITKTEFQEVQQLKNTYFKKFRMLTPEAVVKQCLKDLKKGKTISIPGIENVGLYYLTKFFPRDLTLAVSGMALKPREK